MRGAETAIAFAQLLIGGGIGFVMHRADFCFAGTFRDLFLLQRRTMIRALLLLVVALTGLQALGYLSGLFAYPFPLFGPPSLANLLGGIIFGIGMVLAGGCVVGTLYRLGAGSFLALVTVAGLIGGSLIYAEVDRWWAKAVVVLKIDVGAITLAQLLPVAPWVVAGIVILLLAPLLVAWGGNGSMCVAHGPEGYIQPWLAALLLAGLIFLSTLAAGLPPGVTTTYTKMGGYLLQAVSSPHLAAIPFFQREPLNFTHALSGLAIVGGAGPRLDGIFIVQFPLMVGIVAGGSVSAWRLGEFRFYLRAPQRQVVSALVGGIVMGFASRIAPGCNIWHIAGGLPILSLQSILFVVGLFPGAWLGTRLLLGLVLRPDRYSQAGKE
ncbi:MAG: YeeE/YedE family protein [Geobacter sp.]|nr:YeeE/YedE family protein [Geobacter sp.]